MKLTSNVVVVGGEEEYFIDQDIAYFKKFKGYDVKSFDGETVSDAEFVSVSQTPNIDFETFEVGRDVLILNNAQELKTDKALKARFEKYEGWGEKSRFHLIAYRGKVPAFWGKTKAQVRTHEKLKSWDTQNEVLEWLHNEVKSTEIMEHAETTH